MQSLCTCSSRCCALRQVYCYEDSKLLKLFATVVRILYDFDVLGEDTIKAWYKKGTQPKVRAPLVLVGRAMPRPLYTFHSRHKHALRADAPATCCQIVDSLMPAWTHASVYSTEQ